MTLFRRPRAIAGRCLLGGLLVLSACGPAAPEAGPPASLASVTEAVRETLSGTRARATVAFVAPYWRLAGNPGFDTSITYVAALLDSAGYVPEDDAGPEDALTYRVEQRAMQRPAWEPLGATLSIVGADSVLQRFETNRNMLAVYSFSTPPEGVEAEVVDVGAGQPEDFDGRDVAGKIVYGEAGIGQLFREAVQQRGAAGVLAYRMPDYTQPAVHRHAIQFGSLPYDAATRGWGVLLSYASREALREALAAGPVRVRVTTEARLTPSEEMTLVAEIRGRTRPEERFVFSAHVNEPGANDNASGVGALAEMARTAAVLVRQGRVVPERTLTFLWGDEIVSTWRYVGEDSLRADGIRWGMSLDMVGEDTDRTGGTFLIEKMPDPSAVWTRGDDRHTEWGGKPLTEDDLTPHYFNDFVLRRCLDQADATGWTVRTNPYEGGSDHVPFLRAGKPGLLLWHFTDVFYHTDLDRLQNVSAETLENVGTCALTSALVLTTADGEAARTIVAEVERAALERLATEETLSAAAVAEGAEPSEQAHILDVWTAWYIDALRAAEDIEVGGASPETRARIEEAVARIEEAGRAGADGLREASAS